MKSRFFLLCTTLLMTMVFASCEPSAKHNVLTEAEKAEGWQLLFDGETLNGWRDYNGDSLTAPWFAENGMIQAKGESLSILVSCVGRKLVMGGRVDEEVEAVGDVFGSNSLLTGFYSYGEISPFTPGASCKLHNQTMTITCLGEA